MRYEIWSLYIEYLNMHRSCSTVTLGFYILAFDHNAIHVPKTQKFAIYGARFSAHFRYLFLHFPALVDQIYFIP
jgi:hypothetical protein